MDTMIINKVGSRQSTEKDGGEGGNNIVSIDQIDKHEQNDALYLPDKIHSSNQSTGKKASEIAA